MPRADEVILPFSKPRDEQPSNEVADPTPREPEIIDALRVKELMTSNKVTVVNGTRVIGDLSMVVDPNDIQPYVCVFCDRLDLTQDKDRTAYGELVARLSQGAPSLILNWEERVHETDKLIVYITYTEYLRIAKEALDGQI